VNMRLDRQVFMNEREIIFATDLSTFIERIGNYSSLKNKKEINCNEKRLLCERAFFAIEQICLGGSVGRESDFSFSHLGVEESGSILADGH
jgi:hypothetical protein